MLRPATYVLTHGFPRVLLLAGVVIGFSWADCGIITAGEPIAAHVGTNVTVTNEPLTEPLRNSALQNSRTLTVSSNLATVKTNEHAPRDFAGILETALKEKRAHNNVRAEELLIGLMEEDVPPEVQKAVFIELAVLAHQQGQLPRAQQVYAQFLQKYPNDAAAPEVLLRQGLL